MIHSISSASILPAFAVQPIFSQTPADAHRLWKALKRHPQAETDKDGVLSMLEAEASQVSLGNATFGRMKRLGDNLKSTKVTNRRHDPWEWLFGQKPAKE